MAQSTDSLSQAGTAKTSAIAHVVAHGQLTPRQVAAHLPKNVTPEELDSAIQANIKPAPIHWSNCPDTLHLPGHSKGRSLYDVSLPTYYKESFFSKDTLFHPELPGGRQGVAGDPVPYTIAGDNVITSILLGCFILACFAFAQSQRFIARQAKQLFYQPREGTTDMVETSNEVRFQFFFVLQTCLLLGIGYYFQVRATEDTFTVGQYRMIGLYTGVVAAYFVVKAALYAVTNWVFFEKKRNDQWFKAFLFLFSAEGVLLFPVILLVAYFGLSVQTAITYALVVVSMVKMLAFYKCYLIFFKRIGAILQNILYFCALEVIPLGALWGLFVMIGNHLRINL